VGSYNKYKKNKCPGNEEETRALVFFSLQSEGDFEINNT